MKTFFAIFALVASVAAESKPDAEADPYLLYSNLGYNYGLGYNGYAAPYAHHAVAAAPVVASPVVKTISPAIPAVAAPVVAHTAVHTAAYAAAPVVAAPAVAAVAHPATYSAVAPLAYNGFHGYNNAFAYNNGFGYNGFYNSYANSPYLAAHGVYKREAEAEPEADPALLYRNAYAYGTPYAFNGYNAYNRFAYSPYYNRAAFGYRAYAAPYNFNRFGGYYGY